MTVNPTRGEVREWCKKEGYPIGDHGNVSTEYRDMMVAVTEGYVPKNSLPVKYVADVRKWMMDSGNGIERSMTIAPRWYRKYNDDHQLEDTTAEVLESMESANEGEEFVNLADQKAQEAAEAEAHAVNKEKYTGTAYVTLQMNQSFVGLANCAIFEANSALNRAFAPDGSPTESTHDDLREAYGCLQQARVFLDDLLATFTPEIPSHEHHVVLVNPQGLLNEAVKAGLREMHPLIGKRADYYGGGSFNSGIIKEVHEPSGLFRIDMDKGALDGTTHWLYENDFTIED